MVGGTIGQVVLLLSCEAPCLNEQGYQIARTLAGSSKAGHGWPRPLANDCGDQPCLGSTYGRTANIRSIASFARAAMAGSTVTSGCMSRRVSRSFGRVICFM